MLTKIEVTQAAIAAGRINNCTECPVALAIDTVLDGQFMAVVDYGRISITKGARPYNASNMISLFWTNMDGVVKQFIRNFDSSSELRRSLATPFTFELDIPDVFLRKPDDNAKAL